MPGVTRNGDSAGGTISSSQSTVKANSKNIIVNGWVKNKRGSKNVFFISLNDGSTIENLQIVCETKSISEEGTPQQFPDFTRGMWKTTSPLDIIL